MFNYTKNKLTQHYFQQKDTSNSASLKLKRAELFPEEIGLKNLEMEKLI